MCSILGTFAHSISLLGQSTLVLCGGLLGDHMDNVEPSASCISWSNNGSSPATWQHFASLRLITFHFTFCIFNPFHNCNPLQTNKTSSRKKSKYLISLQFTTLNSLQHPKILPCLLHQHEGRQNSAHGWRNQP